jgi:DNA-binding transcriptional MocR family regulator
MPDDQKARWCAFASAQVALIEDDTYGALAPTTPLKAAKAWDQTGS